MLPYHILCAFLTFVYIQLYFLRGDGTLDSGKEARDNRLKFGTEIVKSKLKRGKHEDYALKSYPYFVHGVGEMVPAKPHKKICNR